MKEAVITFYKTIVDSQEYGSDNDHIISRVFFIINVRDVKTQMHVDVKQPFGESFSYAKNPVEVGNPFKGEPPVDYMKFRDAVEDYYRSIFSVDGSSAVISSTGLGNVRILDSTFETRKQVKLKITSNNPAW